MEKSVSVITKTLFEKLPKDLPFYTQDDLVQYGLPPFLVKRIVHHVYSNILEQISLPDQTWLNPDADSIIEAWHDLKGAIKQELRVPSGMTKEALKKSVRDCVELTVQPKRAIGKHLFGDDQELDITQITERASSVTVNRYLVWSLIRYMEKKEKSIIDRKQAERILDKIDEKVVENYHPLNWLALVKPLFELCGPKVPTDLLRLFFEDKKQNPAAKEFDLLDTTINETEFIEVLSSPDLLYVEGFKDDQQSLFRERLEDDLEDPLNQKFMSSTEDLPEILPVDEESSVPDIALYEVEDEDEDDISGESETAPWDGDEDEIHPDTDEERSLADSFSEPDTDPDLEKEAEPKLTYEPGLETEPEEEAEAESMPESEAESELKKEKDKEIDLEPELNSERDSEIVATPDIASVEPGLADEKNRSKEKSALFEITDTDTDTDTEPDQPKQIDEHSEEEEIVNSKIVADDEIIETVETESDSEFEETDEEEADEEESLASRFIFDVEPDDELQEEEDLNDAATIYDELNLSRKGAEPSTLDLFSMPSEEEALEEDEMDLSDSDVSELEESEISEDPLEEEEPSAMMIDTTGSDSVDTDEEELPMWRSFLEREDVEATSSFQFDDSRFGVTGEDEIEEEDSDESVSADVEDEESELLDEDGFIEEPIYDLTKEVPPIEQKIGDLNEWMLDGKEKIVEEIFGDSEDAYEQALAEIIEYEDWKSASRYIEKEIFARNRIDLYAETAVDFTDRLHSYFLEKKS